MFPFDPTEISENLWFSDVFRGIKREQWQQKGLYETQLFRRSYKYFLHMFDN